MTQKKLRDNFGRVHDYLRISLTEKCNLRCSYCMPADGIELKPRSNYMNASEVYALAKEFTALGVKKIRLTGGEPLVRKDFAQIIESLSSLPVELTLTTNGILLDAFIEQIKSAGIHSINISLDTLKPDRFNEITRRNDFDRVLNNIYLALDHGLHVKVNAVLIKGVNDDEIISLVDWTKHKSIDVRFIEFMPFDGNNWNWERKISEQEIMDQLQNHYGEKNIIALESKANNTSRNYKLKDALGSFGIISTVTNPFCDTCNRIRLTADGKIKNCLFSQSETDLLTAFRKGEDIRIVIEKEILSKKYSRSGLDMDDPLSVVQHKNRAMISIGG
jgi:molybdenum cofactor biosynthesis protein A